MPSPVPIAQLHHFAYRARDAEEIGVTDHHIFKSIYFFDPNGVRLELSAQVADEFQMLRESRDARARLDAWTVRKNQWRIDRSSGAARGALKPQQNDRPEVTARVAAAS